MDNCFRGCPVFVTVAIVVLSSVRILRPFRNGLAVGSCCGHSYIYGKGPLCRHFPLLWVPVPHVPYTKQRRGGFSPLSCTQSKADLGSTIWVCPKVLIKPSCVNVCEMVLKFAVSHKTLAICTKLYADEQRWVKRDGRLLWPDDTFTFESTIKEEGQRKQNRI